MRSPPPELTADLLTAVLADGCSRTGLATTLAGLPRWLGRVSSWRLS